MKIEAVGFSDDDFGLPEHLVGTTDGARLLRVAAESGWKPLRLVVAARWPVGRHVTGDDDKLRTKLRDLAGRNQHRLLGDARAILAGQGPRPRSPAEKLVEWVEILTAEPDRERRLERAAAEPRLDRRPDLLARLGLTEADLSAHRLAAAAEAARRAFAETIAPGKTLLRRIDAVLVDRDFWSGHRELLAEHGIAWSEVEARAGVLAARVEARRAKAATTRLRVAEARRNRAMALVAEQPLHDLGVTIEDGGERGVRLRADPTPWLGAWPAPVAAAVAWLVVRGMGTALQEAAGVTIFFAAGSGLVSLAAVERLLGRRAQLSEGLTAAGRLEPDLVGMLMAQDVIAVLGVRQGLFEKLVAEGILPVAGREPFHKWGRTLEARLFDPRVVAMLAGEGVVAAREAEFAARAAARAAAAEEKRRQERAVAARARDEARMRTGLDAPAGLFPLARARRRRIVFHAGPTNSGKTRAALAAMEGRSGVYAAPLRLLAMEAYDKLAPMAAAAGLGLRMATGEEEIGDPEAPMLACTVEGVPVSRRFEVAVIDEIQMLADPERGWAWTRALLGVAADEVHLCGAPEALGFVERVLAGTGETLERIEHARLGPLEALDAPVGISDLAAGDAVVMFSKAGVMRVRKLLVDAGRTAAIIYGAMPPELRRIEAARFQSGAAEVLVATDAIGMGLNLPIRRVLFGTMEKFDGRVERHLLPGEIRQIGGRAGRGVGEVGQVGVFDVSGKKKAPVARRIADIASIRAALVEVSPSLRGKPAFRPDAATLREIGAALGARTWVARVREARRLLGEGGFSIGETAAWEEAAAIADIAASRLPGDGSLFLTAPTDVPDPKWGSVANAALIEGIERLGRGKPWPLPGLPAEEPRSHDALRLWEETGKVLAVARWFARNDRDGRCDAEELAARWEHYVAIMAAALISKASFQKGCRSCGTPLPWDSRFGICEGCYGRRRHWSDDW